LKHTCVKLRSTEKLQNLKSKNKKIYVKTEIEKHKNNIINKLEYIKMFVIHFYLNNTNKKRNGRIKKRICLLIFILYFKFKKNIRYYLFIT